MKIHSPCIASFLLVLSFLGTQTACAGTPAGEVSQLSGFVMALKANGALKVLSTKSLLEAGDTLVSEENTYVRIGLADGRQAVLGPRTRLKITSPTVLSLAAGQLQILAPVQSGTGRLTIEAGETTVDAGAASFNLFYSPDAATAIAQRAYAHASLAALTSAVQSDAGTSLPIWEKVVQANIPAGPKSSLAPGLYVQVIDGLISLANRGGTSSFAAGQFGYTPSFKSPPVTLPANPGMQFTPPPQFSVASTQRGSTSTGGSNKSSSVDCEVR